MTDMINHPAHYNLHPSGVECIQITEHMGFLLGNAFKYVFRAGLKGDAAEDLGKARFYICRAQQQLIWGREDSAYHLPMLDALLDHEPDCAKADAMLSIWQADMEGNRSQLIHALIYIDGEIARLAHG